SRGGFQVTLHGFQGLHDGYLLHEVNNDYSGAIEEDKLEFAFTICCTDVITTLSAV
ncbi:hypothetical protein E2562_017908, partial [Oryza meyeriana var. granulata]